MNTQNDLLIRGGRLIDPAQHIDDIRDVAIKSGKVLEVGNNLPVSQAKKVIDATSKIVTPGLIDMHTHVFKGQWLGVDADKVGVKSGVTTMVDTGSSGAANFGLFRDYIISQAKTRILPFLNIWVTGSENTGLPGDANFDGMANALKEGRDLPKVLGYFDDIRYASVDATIAVIEENRDKIFGVKVWVNCLVAHGSLEPLLRAKQVARKMNLPLMVCTYFGPPALKNIVPLLDDGDIQTHCFGIFTDLVQADGKVIPEAIEARARGVIFDIGHGAGSFDFGLAQGAIKSGFLPDTISTDIHAQCIHGPTYDLPTTMTKFLLLGLSLPDVIRATTSRPAEILHLQDQIGSLRLGMEADVAIFDLVDGEFDLVDTEGKHRTASQRLINTLTVKAGEVLN